MAVVSSLSPAGEVPCRAPGPQRVAEQFIFFLLLLIAFSSEPSFAAGAPKNVLVLFSNEAELPANQAASRGLNAAFNSDSPEKPTTYTEFLDMARFPGTDQDERLAIFLKEKYAAIHFDLAIALGPQALDFITKHRDELVPNIPVIFAGIGEDALKERKLPTHTTGIISRWDFAKTLELALLLQPNLRNVAVVTGSAPFDRAWEAQAREQFRSYESRLSFIYLSGLRLEDLLARVNNLQNGTAIVFLSFFADPSGKRFIPRDVLERIAKVANAPSYSVIDTTLGVGGVGGYMDTLDTVGEQTARLGIRILNGENPDDIEPHLSQSHRNIVDWRALQHWGLSLSALPPGSEVRYKQPTAWEQYKTEIILLATVMILQTILLFKFYTETRKRRAAEREAKASKERMDLAISAANVGLWDWDLRSDKIWATASCHQMFGLGQNDGLTSLSFVETVSKEDRSRVRSEIDRAIAERRPFDSEYRISLPDGSLRWVATQGSPGGGTNGEPNRMVGAVLDITARKQAELETERQQKELAHLTRVSVLGALSGAIAHELNQPLTAILSNAQAAARILAREPIDTEEIRQILGDIVQDDKRAGDVIKHLRTLLKKGESLMQTVAINDLVCEVLALSHSDLVLKNVAVSKRLAEKLPAILGDPIQLQQVLINLVVNACEAMSNTPTNGRLLMIETRLDDNSRIRISVGDSGDGVPEDTEKLFDPFFTTKTLGLGLGLPICRSIVAAHGGRLWAESGSPEGAVFHVELPPEASVQA